MTVNNHHNTHSNSYLQSNQQNLQSQQHDPLNHSIADTNDNNYSYTNNYNSINNNLNDEEPPSISEHTNSNSEKPTGVPIPQPQQMMGSLRHSPNKKKVWEL